MSPQSTICDRSAGGPETLRPTPLGEGWAANLRPTAARCLIREQNPRSQDVLVGRETSGPPIIGLVGRGAGTLVPAHPGMGGPLTPKPKAIPTPAKRIWIGPTRHQNPH